MRTLPKVGFDEVYHERSELRIAKNNLKVFNRGEPSRRLGLTRRIVSEASYVLEKLMQDYESTRSVLSLLTLIFIARHQSLQNTRLPKARVESRPKAELHELFIKFK